ncbi:MAG: hypothetical protein NTW29_17025 [Bacteroidetes bacterium]|nr:hypothetical protein [Bacteroidota bacterium]
MSKLFIFGIGGTGSRVVKSLTFLLGAGVDIKATEIIPVIIDPDRANGDMNRTVDILKNYQRIRIRSHSARSGFFKAKITTLNELVDNNQREKLTSPDFRFELDGVQNERFMDFIDYNNLDKANKALAGLLFSEENLEADMEVGFKGNPNIGSVVLNQLKDSSVFRHFASNFEENDRIFIISSIFGGTGAAGFPLILKNIRNAPEDMPNFAFLRKAKVGAITILPYFGVTPDPNSKIDKATFISKTKAALNYYERNVSGNRSLNALYYIGDKDTKDYDNKEGAADQRNDAHFVEVAAALSIIDFMNLHDDMLENDASGMAKSPVYKEFGIKDAAPELSFATLGPLSKDRILKPLTQYKLMFMFMRDKLEECIDKYPWSNNGKVRIDKNFVTQPFYSDFLNAYNKAFSDWLIELGRNKVGFKPFRLDAGDKNVYYVLNEYEPVKSFNPLAKKNYELYIDQLNQAEKEIGDPPAEQKFMDMFYYATKNLVQKKFNV